MYKWFLKMGNILTLDWCITSIVSLKIFLESCFFLRGDMRSANCIRWRNWYRTYSSLSLSHYIGVNSKNKTWALVETLPNNLWTFGLQKFQRETSLEIQHWIFCQFKPASHYLAFLFQCLLSAEVSLSTPILLMKNNEARRDRSDRCRWFGAWVQKVRHCQFDASKLQNRLLQFPQVSYTYNLSNDKLNTPWIQSQVFIASLNS